MSKEIISGGNVVSRLVPEVWKSEQWRMQQEDCGKDQGEHMNVIDLSGNVCESLSWLQVRRSVVNIARLKNRIATDRFSSPAPAEQNADPA